MTPIAFVLMIIMVGSGYLFIKSDNPAVMLASYFVFVASCAKLMTAL